MERIALALASFSVGWLYALIVAVALFFGWEAADYGRFLGWETAGFPPAARTEAQFLVIWKTLGLVLPFLLAAAAARLIDRPALALGLRAAFVFLPFWLLFVDRSLFLSVGRHLSDLWAFRNVPHGGQAAGQASVWIASATKAAFVAAAISAGELAASQALERRVLVPLVEGQPRRCSWVAISGGFAVAVLLGLTLIPHAQAIDLEPGQRERLYGLMPVDLRLFEGKDRTSNTPEGKLAQGLEEVYRSHFSEIRTQTPPSSPEIGEGPRPPIVFVVVESWRKDALTPELMPRLSKWSNTGHRFEAHEAGTYSSEAGMYALLYGRSNLSYHETLDAKVRPLLFTWLRSIGYEISYYSGHPIKWLRREEFLSADTVDHLEHSDDGAWPDWDRRALKKMVAHVRDAKKPNFSLVFLMSSHFEYQYPPEYEKNLPVAHSKFQVTQVNAFDEDDREPHYNRYKNTMAFFDDLLTETLEALPDDALIVLTGDHGEAFYEGGHYGHGFAFTDPVLDVPLVIRFPRDSAGVFAGAPSHDDKTLHRDIIGWLANYLNGGPLFLDGFHGNQSWKTGRASHLSVYSDPNRTQSYTMLSMARPGQDEIRARITMRSADPTVRLLGFEQKYGLPTSAPHLDDATRSAIEDAFEQELETISR